MADVVAYKNSNTGQIVVYTQAQPRLEALNEWEQVDASEVTYSVADAHDRASAERASIEAAAAIRLDTAAGGAAAGISAAQATNTAIGGGAQPGALPTLSTGNAGEIGQPVTLLDKMDPSRDTGSTSFEENKRAAEKEMANPPRDGVLKRAKRDQKEGKVQIGPNPQEHAGPRAAAKSSSSTSASSEPTTK